MNESDFELTLGMNHEQLRCLYVTMDNSHRNWSGGDAYEQEILRHLRDESWKLLLESQFD